MSQNRIYIISTLFAAIALLLALFGPSLLVSQLLVLTGAGLFSSKLQDAPNMGGGPHGYRTVAYFVNWSVSTKT